MRFWEKNRALHRDDLPYDPKMLEYEPNVEQIIGSGSPFAQGVGVIQQVLNKYGCNCWYLAHKTPTLFHFEMTGYKTL